MNMEDFEPKSVVKEGKPAAASAKAQKPDEKTENTHPLLTKIFWALAIITLLSNMVTLFNGEFVFSLRGVVRIIMNLAFPACYALIAMSFTKSSLRMLAFCMPIVLILYNLYYVMFNGGHAVNYIPLLAKLLMWIVFLANEKQDGKLNPFTSFFIVVEAFTPFLVAMFWNTGFGGWGFDSLSDILHILSGIAGFVFTFIILFDALYTHNIIKDSRNLKRNPNPIMLFGFLYLFVIVFTIIGLPASSGSSSSSNEPWKKLGVSKKTYMETYYDIAHKMKK